MECELLDTGVFDADRYFDVVVEYAKTDPEDVLIRIIAHNRDPENAKLDRLPTLWFRNTWSWGESVPNPMQRKGQQTVLASCASLGDRLVYCDGSPQLLFTENESNSNRLWARGNASTYVKDAFHSYVVSGRPETVNPSETGTKAAAHYCLEVPAGGARLYVCG
ncbi:MAG: hypothetical protein WA715_03155 [Candidatus Acidiferrum sp.]